MKNISILFVACLLAVKGYSQCGTAPTSITATPTVTTINGCYFTLTAVGGVLPVGGNYYWYLNSCGGQFLGTGISLSSSVLSPLDFFVRIEAPCGNSACVSITVTSTSLAPPAVITANGPTTWCSPGSVVLNANTGAGLKYQWRGTAVGTISGATNSTFLVTAAIYGGITCDVSYSPCWTTVSNTIYVTATPQPTGHISIPNTTMCPGTFNFLHLTGSDYTYNIWQLNGVNLSGTVNMWEIIPQTSGTYTCFVSNACGSLTTNAITVNVLSTSVSISTALTHICPGVTTTTLSATGGAGNSWQWRLASTNIAGATNSFYVATTPGNYDCVLTNSCGTYTSNSLTITSDAPPTDISPTGTVNLCSSSITLFANMSSGLTRQWQRNGSNIAGATNYFYTVTASGNYNCLVSNSCATLSTSVTTVVGSSFTATIAMSGIAAYCAGTGSVTFSANTGPGITYQWYGSGQTLIPGATNSTYTTNSSGAYYCEETGTCGPVNSNSIQLPAPGAPVAFISSTGGTNLCPGTNLMLQANTAFGNTYQWRLNGANISGAVNSFQMISIAGDYDVIVTNACASSTSNTLSIIATFPITAAITAGGPTTFCQGGSVLLSANSGNGLGYQWKLNSLVISGATTSTYSATNSGNYSCIVVNTCGSSVSNIISVSVNSSPTASITAGGSTSLCQGGSVLLSANTGTGLTYQWRNNTNPISGETNSTYAATTAGSYSCIITNACGSTTSNTITITINLAPTAVITAGGPTTFCLGGSVLLSANTGPSLTYQWRVNTSPISGATNSTYSSTNGGNINCVVTNACGSSTSNTIAVNVLVPPTAPYVTSLGSTAFCAGGSVQLNTTSIAGNTLQWRLNTTPISGATATTYYATAAGNYDCVATNSCGSATSNSISATLVIPVPGSITAGGPTTFCQGGSVLLTANTGTGLTYQWRRNGSSISGATTITYLANQAGNYDCIVFSLISSCPTTISNVITVAVNAGSTATITPNGPLTYCSISPTTLSANTGTGFTYVWKKNGVAISGATASTYKPTSSGSYTVTITSGCGTVTSAAVSVTVLTAPSTPGTISGPGTFCSGQAGVVYSIAPVATATSYNWQLPNGAVITSGQGTTSITVTFGNKNGNIRVQAVNNCGNSNWSSKNVNKNCREAGFEVEREFEISVFPNPGSIFNLEVNNTAQPFSYELSDLTGVLIEKRDNLQPGTTIQLGENLSNGIYLIQIICGDERRVLKLIKQ